MKEENFEKEDQSKGKGMGSMLGQKGTEWDATFSSTSGICKACLFPRAERKYIHTKNF